MYYCYIFLKLPPNKNVNYILLLFYNLYYKGLIRYKAIFMNIIYRMWYENAQNNIFLVIIIFPN